LDQKHYAPLLHKHKKVFNIIWAQEQINIILSSICTQHESVWIDWARLIFLLLKFKLSRNITTNSKYKANSKRRNLIMHIVKIDMVLRKHNYRTFLFLLLFLWEKENIAQKQFLLIGYYIFYICLQQLHTIGS
jgi:hypothetical protein